MAVDPKRAEVIFLAAIEQPDPAARRALLERECGPDQELRQRVEALLQAHDEPGTLLQHPSIGADPVSEGPAPDQLGQRIGPYKLLQQIGEGGMGTVYMAEQSAPVHRMVALKIIKPGMDSRQIIARFEAERQALALMDHPNVARVLDGGTTSSGRPYFVMELVQGVPITEYCDDHRLAAQSRLRLFVEVCHAVQHAHQKGIIHRDLKPSNVLVAEYDGKPVPKVIDFGVAKAIGQQLTDATLFTAFGQVIGTVEYMSPEQAQFHPLDVDTRSDVYSLGVILYELLTGQTPFDRRRLGSAALDEVLRIIREEDPQRPSTRLSASQTLPSLAAKRHLEPKKLTRLVRGELDWIVMKALEKDRGRRYETANSFAADILRYLADEPVLAGAPSRPYRLRKFVRRHRISVLASLAVAVALLTGVIGTTIGLIGQSRQRAVAEQERAKAQQSAAIAEAIYRFQGEMFFSVDPSQMRGGDVKVLDVIQAAVKELDAGKLRDHPLVEAGLRETIGSAFRSLSRFKDAEPQLRKALELRGAALSPTDPVFAGNLFELALVLRNLHNLAEAETLYRQSLMIARQSFPKGDRRLCPILANLSELLASRGRFEEAEMAVRECVEVARLLPTGDATLGDAVCSLAIVLFRQNKMLDAEQYFREGADLKREAVGAEHPELAIRLDDLATCLAAQDNYDQAEQCYLEALAIRRKTLPPTHLQLAQNLNNLGLLYQRMNRLPDAQRLCGEAVAIGRQTMNPDNPELGMFLNNYGLALHKRENLDEAERVFQEAWRITRNMPVGTPQPAIVAANYASLLVSRNKAGEALPLFQQSLAGFELSGVKDPIQQAIVRKGLGQALLTLNRFSEAETELLAAEQLQAGNLKQQPARYFECLSVLVRLYTAWDKAEPGKGYDAKADIWRAKLQPQSSSTRLGADAARDRACGESEAAADNLGRTALMEASSEGIAGNVRGAGA